MNKLFSFQHSAVEFLVSRNRALLASDAGTGKTIIAISAVNELIDTEGLHVLVLCPKSVKLNWEREIEKWADHNKAQYWEVHNWDRLITPAIKDILSMDWDSVIADESHVCLKNPSAKRCKVFLEQIIPKAKRVWLATATPASKSGLDYFCTLKVLLPDHMKNWTKASFQKEFCNEEYSPFTYTRKKYVGFNNTEILKEVFSKVSLRHKKEDVLKDLPPKLYTNLFVEVDEDIVAQNLRLDREHVKELMRTGQPLPGHIAHVMQANAKGKLDQAIEWIENFPENESLVIFAWHQSIIQELRERIPGSEVIHGQINGLQRQQIVDKFSQAMVKRLICNMQAGGVGLNLQVAKTALYIELPFSPTYWIQSQDRIHRIGSVGSHIHIVRMLGAGTIDEIIWSVLDERMKVISEVGV
jgi:SWI/SNF-related matrix-associated actin-dependent regulator 1 of chromatin subfamily A